MHSKLIDKCGKNPQSARIKLNYHTKCSKNCHKFLSVYNSISGQNQRMFFFNPEHKQQAGPNECFRGSLRNFRYSEGVTSHALSIVFWYFYSKAMPESSKLQVTLTQIASVTSRFYANNFKKLFSQLVSSFWYWNHARRIVACNMLLCYWISIPRANLTPVHACRT